MAELDFPSMPIERIAERFDADGCVLLRRCVDPNDLARLHREVDGFAPLNAVHFGDWEMADRGLPHFYEYLFGEKHIQLLKRLLGGRFRVSRNTATRRVDPAGDSDGYQRPLQPHLDAFFHSFEWTVNFWVPFIPCGRAAPSLGVVRAAAPEAKTFAGYDGRRRRRGRGTSWNFANFSRAAFSLDDLRVAFGERVWTPDYDVGDAMLLSNWTLHFTHSLPGMDQRRDNLELRFTSRASLSGILTDRLGPHAARKLAALRRVFTRGHPTERPGNP